MSDLANFDSSQDNINKGYANLKAQANAKAQAAVEKGQSVLHDFTMPLLAKNFEAVGKSAIQVSKNVGAIDAAPGSYADTYLTKGITGVIKKGASDVEQSIINAANKPIASSASNAVNSANDIEMSDMASNDTVSAVNTTSSDAISSVTSSSIPAGAGSATDASAGALGDSGGMSSAQASLFTQTTGEDAVKSGVDATLDTVGDTTNAVLDTITTGSSVFDEVPVAGLLTTGILAGITELASYFDTASPTIPKVPDVQTGLNIGFNTI